MRSDHVHSEDALGSGEPLGIEPTRPDEELQLRRDELDLKRRDLALREREQRQTGWRNPLVLGVVAAVIGLVGNAVVTALNGYYQRILEEDTAIRQDNLATLQHDRTLQLERSKAEARRILEIV
jgi:hypothetical protein